jgi:hypothetical protein
MLQNEKLHKLDCSVGIIRTIKTNIMRIAGRVERMARGMLAVHRPIIYINRIYDVFYTGW